MNIDVSHCSKDYSVIFYEFKEKEITLNVYAAQIYQFQGFCSSNIHTIVILYELGWFF